MTASQERMDAHAVRLPKGYVPNPDMHLGNIRDATHFMKASKWLKSIGAKTVLDVGCYDGWLDFLLIREGYSLTGVEMIPELADAALRYAERNFLSYTVYTSHVLDACPFFMADDQQIQYDAVVCFETLEHMTLEEAAKAASLLSQWSRKGVLVSLPDQDHRQNAQHLWTPTEEVIKGIWGDKPGYSLEYVPYQGTTIPSNWFVSHGV
jgi:2-polyprenyl-3-methyl-5-hydroxy-6-metoxy-1,4-benzoquinol methylase